MKKISLKKVACLCCLFIVLLIFGTYIGTYIIGDFRTTNRPRRVLDEDIVAENMQSYLQKKYNVKYKIENVRMLSKMIDGLTWFMGRAVLGEESFTVMANEFSNEFRDDKYLKNFEEQLNIVSNDAFKGLWNDAEVLAKIKLPDYAFKNYYWTQDSKLIDLLNTEHVIVSCVIIIPESLRNEEEDWIKFHKYISTCVNNGIIPASFSLDYIDSNGNRSTQYFVNIKQGDAIPDESDMERYIFP